MRSDFALFQEVLARNLAQRIAGQVKERQAQLQQSTLMDELAGLKTAPNQDRVGQVATELSQLNGVAGGRDGGIA